VPGTRNYEAYARQPLLQGGGVDFNRIAGPNGTPGLINGVVIARHQQLGQHGPSSKSPCATW